MLDIDSKFDNLLDDLTESLPKEMPAGCAEATLRNILKVLDIEDELINNIMVSLSGGLGGYKSEEGWSGPCGAVVGGCAAVGAILGGKKPMTQNLVMPAYLKSAQFAKEFENKFGTVLCPNLSGYDFSDPSAMMEYMKENIWGKKCYKYVLWAIDNVRKMMNKELKRSW
jgi:C_GCAxxG_C_C family probable redox protein